MRAVLCAALATSAACRIDLDHRPDAETSSGRTCKISTAQVCIDTETHSDFAWIEHEIFVKNCFGSSCHDSPTASGKIDLSEGHSYATLMGSAGTGGVKSDLDPSRDLVVPGSPAKSYLYFIIHAKQPDEADPPSGPPPANVGYMPMNNALLCCQKMDAIERWITAGALNN